MAHPYKKPTFQQSHFLQAIEDFTARERHPPSTCDVAAELNVPYAYGALRSLQRKRLVDKEKSPPPDWVAGWFLTTAGHVALGQPSPTGEGCDG